MATRANVPEPLPPDTAVEVHVAFTGDWVRGFAVADGDGEGYRLRRTSDGTVLPHRFAADDLRPST